MDSNIHCIKQLQLEAHLDDEQAALDLRKNLKEMMPSLSEDLAQALEHRFTDEKWTFINRVELEVSLKSDSLINAHELYKEISLQIQQKISALENIDVKKSTGFAFKTNELDKNPLLSLKSLDLANDLDSSLDAFVSYLKTGRFPWFVHQAEVFEQLCVDLLSEIKFLQQIDRLDLNLQSRKRWLAFLYKHQYPHLQYLFAEKAKTMPVFSYISLLLNSPDSLFEKELCIELAAILYFNVENYEKQTFIKTIQALYTLNEELKLKNNYSHNFKSQAFDGLIVYFKAQGVKTFTKASFSDIREHSSLKQQEKTQTLISQNWLEEDIKDSQELIRVECAGLVLFHPFLQRLFSKLKYIDSDKSIYREKLKHAATCLYFLATNEQGPAEYQLSLIKVMLGLRPDEALLFTEQGLLNKQEIDELNDLSKSLVHHWQKLGKTSSEGMRKSFIARQGLLREYDSHWDLHIERKSHDLLLDFLPFSISTVRLAWLSKEIRVTW